MDDGEHCADGEREFVTERHIEQDEEHRYERRHDGTFTDFLSNNGANFIRA